MPHDPSSPSESGHLLEGLDPKTLFAEAFARESPFPDIPGFEIHTKLGEGGMGLVYRAWQESLQREVALKLVRPELATLEPDSVFDRLEREAQAMAKLKHPNIVAVHDFIRFDDESVALVLELIEGETLRTLLARGENGLPIEVAMPLIEEIGQALAAAHDAGLVHRDVKPENVLIDLEGRAHVTDFGLALPIEEDLTRLTRTGTTVGTLAYLAPEQLDGAPVNVAADQFSFAVVIYEMLTGVRPRGVVEQPHDLRQDVHPAASRILLRAMSRTAEARFESVSIFLSELLAAQRKPKSSISRRSAIVATGSFLGCGAVGGTLWRNHASGWIDLLDEIDVSRAIKGQWQINRDGSVTSKTGLAILPLPIGLTELGNAYEVKCRVLQTESVDGFGLCFESQNGFGAVEFNNAGKPGVSGIQKINGRMLRDETKVAEVKTELDQPLDFRLRVDRGKLTYFVENELIRSYEVNPSDTLHILWAWDWNRPQEGLALASLNAPTTFSDVSWRAIT